MPIEQGNKRIVFAPFFYPVQFISFFAITITLFLINHKIVLIANRLL